MTDLNTLAKHRDELLKAELAALLHNLGKLDVNFLSKSSSAGLSASNEIKAKHYEIEEYQFKRFAAPNGALLSSSPSRSIESYEREAHDIFTRWQRQNGPLYFCSVEDRVKANAELQRINEQINVFQQELRNPATPDKPSLGKQLADLQRDKLAAKGARDRAIASIYGDEKKEQSELEGGFRAITISIGGEQWTIADLITLFWDVFFHKPNNDDYQRVSALAPFWKPNITTGLTALLALAHGEVSGGEKPSEGEDGLSGGEKPSKGKDGRWGDLCLTTAFGYKELKLYLWEMSDQRRKIVDLALSYGSKPPSESRVDFLEKARQYLRHALSDTRWPYNEISLWDYSASTAALFKAATAAAVLTGSIPPVADVRWRLLAISYHGLDFWGQAHHIPDLLARREAVRQGLNAVRDLLEVTYPLGNEIYRDEYGSVFVVPDYDKLLDLKDEDGQSLEQRLCTAFNISDATGVAGELQPQLYLSKRYGGKQIKLAEVLQQRSRTNHADLEQIKQAWDDKLRPTNAPICTVCGVRPVGYTPPEIKLHNWASSAKAQKRNLCRVCLARRGRRAEDWLAKKDNAFERTIWTDEVADQHGRLALIVGRFELDGWLDGTLIATLQKSASFARIQRCWQTTRTFWNEVEQQTIPETVQATQPRWQIRPANAEDLARNLGDYHAYELDVRGRRLSVCWDPESKLFWTTDNLAYIDKLLPEQTGSRDPLQRLREAITGKDLAIYEPGGYGQASTSKQQAERCTIAEELYLYAPYIPLVTEPAIFFALVPASHALAVAEEIKKKYDNEMGRVKDRLPLYLGIIFAPRRTPMRALLDAGRTMLNFPFAWEAWRVKKKVSAANQPHRVELTRNGQCLTWCYPTTMGDGTTADQWYPYLLTEEPVQGQALTPTDFRHVKDLSAGDTVYIRSSRFDFAFLDTTGRRFALHYNQDGRRSDSHTRPYLLDDLSRFENTWAALRLLERTQTYQIIQTIEETRALWFGNDADARSLDDPTFRQFASDTLADAPWPDNKKWWAFDHHEREQLIAASVRGELADLAELYFELLKQKD